jgi:hypothetical protein
MFEPLGPSVSLPELDHNVALLARLLHEDMPGEKHETDVHDSTPTFWIAVA